MKQEVSPKLVIAAAVLIVALLGAAFWWRTTIHAADQGVSAVAAKEQTPQFKAQVEAEDKNPSRYNQSKAAIETAETQAGQTGPGR